MADQIQPVRTESVTHRCVCRMVHVQQHRGRFRDECYAMVDNPDQAFCNHCEREGHPEHPDQVRT
jgi:hypothetical protein